MRYLGRLPFTLVTFCLGMACDDDECWPWLESALIVAIVGGLFGILTEYLRIRLERKREKTDADQAEKEAARQARKHSRKRKRRGGDADTAGYQFG